MKDYFYCGHLVECFTLLPSITYSWMQTYANKAWEIQFAWLFWYFSVGNIRIELKKNGYGK